MRKEANSRRGGEPSRGVSQANEPAVHLAIDGKALRGTGKQAYGGEAPQKQVLHVGCGAYHPEKLHKSFAGWKEIRLDIDPAVAPDIVASLTDKLAGFMGRQP